MSKLTPEQAIHMAELRERGWSYDRLAAKFGISPGACHYRCLSQGALSPRSLVVGQSDHRPTRAFGKPVRCFTPDEDERIMALSREGLSPYLIAKRMERPYSSVRVRLLTLGAREEGAEASA